MVWQLRAEDSTLTLIKGVKQTSGVTPLIYKILNEKGWANLISFQLAWNKDCQSCSKPKLWPILSCQSQSQYIRLQQFKVLLKSYVTLVSLGHFKADNNIKCWKGCDHKGTYFHCWWSCLVVQKFWKLIAHQIHKITSFDIPFTTEVILLDCWKVF